VAVGICEALHIDDYITSTLRGHGHCLAKGATPDRMFAELLGKEAGYCRGKGGSIHIADPTFTLSNLGMYLVDQFNAIITSPQAAILAVGTIQDRVVAMNGKPVVRAMITLTLSCDLSWTAPVRRCS
jgi:hypothetical protein